MDCNKSNTNLLQRLVFLFKTPIEDGKDRYQEILREEKIASVVIPALSFRYVNQDLLRSSLLQYNQYSAIILTSVRAVDAVVKATKGTGDITTDFPPSLQCFVVGHATEEAAQHAGFKPEGGDTGNAQALAQHILENLKDSTKPMLFPCSSIHRETLPDILISKGFQLDEVVSYETCAHENLADSLKSSLSIEGVPDFVVFFSPSGVYHVHSIKDDIPFSLENTKIIALGPATSQSIRDLGLMPFGTAEKPDPQSLLQLLKTLFSCGPNMNR